MVINFQSGSALFDMFILMLSMGGIWYYTTESIKHYKVKIWWTFTLDVIAVLTAILLLIVVIRHVL